MQQRKESIEVEEVKKISFIEKIGKKIPIFITILIIFL